MVRVYAIAVFAVPFILASIWFAGNWSDNPIAKIQVTVDGVTKQYFSYLPPKRGSDKRPTCGWRGGREATMKADKTIDSYDAIHLACSFDVSDKTRIQSEYGFSLELRRYKGRQFEAFVAIVYTSKDGLILKSNLMEGKSPRWRCRAKNCGIEFSKNSLPDPKSRSDVLAFDFSFLAPMTNNLSDKTIHMAEFQLSGEVPRHFPN